MFFLAVIDPVAVELGPLAVRWYGIIVVSSVMAAILLATRLAPRRGLDPEFIPDLAMWAVPAGFIGARLYEVFVLQWPYYSQHPWDIPAIWQGGLAIHGGIIGGVLVGIWYARRHRQPIGPWADAIAPGILLAQGIGRWGNFFNQEAYGNAVSAEFMSRFPAWFQEQMFIDGAYRHPTFLYESVWNFLGTGILLWFFGRRPPAGSVFFGYLVVYNIGRFFIEGIRLDSSFLPGDLRVAQVMAAALVVLGLAGLAWRRGWLRDEAAGRTGAQGAGRG